MKHTAAVLIILLSVFPVFSDSFSSNELGQIVQTESPYSVEINGNSLILSKEGIPLTETITVTAGNSKTVTKTNLEDNSKTITKYNKGYLESIQNLYADGTSDSTFYIYNDGVLVCTEFTSADGNRTVEYYLRNASDSSLFAVRRYENTTLIGTDYIYIDDNIYTRSNNMVVSGNFNVDDSGNVSFERDGVTYTYGPDSLLQKEEDEQKVIYYSYTDGVIANKRTVSKSEPVTVVMLEYINGSESVETTYVNYVITQRIDYITDEMGMVKTVYNSGIPVARVYYRSDNKKVARVEYL